MAYDILDSRDIDQAYTPESPNAQSGKAVDEALTLFKEIKFSYCGLQPKNYDATYCKNGIYEVSNSSYFWYYDISLEIGTITCWSEEIPDLTSGSKVYIEFGEFDGSECPINKLAVKIDKYVTREKFVKTIKNNILNYIDYEIVNNEAVITSCDLVISGDHIIPETIDGYPVTDIGQAFVECTDLTGITIPGTIKTVGDYAFSDCFNLISVIFSEGVTSLVGCPFEDCGNLRFVVIPESLTFIDVGAFDYADITDVYYAGSKEQWDKITNVNNNENLTNATIHYNQAPAKKSDLVELKNNIENIYGIKYKELSNNDEENPLILEDNTEYTATKPINNLTIEYPDTDTDFICSLYFTTASDSSVSINLPESKYIGVVPDFKPGETWELNIKNRVVVAGKVVEG